MGHIQTWFSLYAYAVVISSLQPSSHLMSNLTQFDQVNVLLHKKHVDPTILSKIKHQNLNVDGLIYMSKIK